MSNEVRNPMQLVRISQPHDDENFFGYLLKLSEINYFGGVHWLVHHAGLNPNACTTLSKKMLFDPHIDLSPLSGLAGEPLELLEALRYPYTDKGRSVLFQGHPISVHALRPMKPKICPACLSESNHARMIWDLAMVTCCSTHGCLLIDHCPGCGKPISWHRKGVSTCKCDFDFRTIAPEPASEPGSRITRLVDRKLGDDAEPPPGSSLLAKLTLDELSTLVSFFSAFLAHQQADTSGKAFARSRSVAQLHQNLADVANLFDQWPNNFIHFLQTTDFKPAKNAKFGLYHRFGSFYPAFKRLFLNDRFAFIRTAFENYQLKHFKGYVRHQNMETKDAVEKDAHLSKAETAKRLKTSERWVDRLLAAGKLKGIKVPSGNRHMVLIEKESVNRLQQRHRNLLSMTAVKKVLRIKRKTVICLVENGLLSCERGPTVDGFFQWKFSINDLEQLISQIERHVPELRLHPSPSELLTFSELRQSLSAFQVSTLELFRMVVSGQLKPYQRMDMIHIDSFLFKKSEVLKCIRTKLQNLIRKGYRMEHFANLIGVSLDAAYEMEKFGLIKATSGCLPKVGKIISKEDAEQFYRTYITSTEIAKQCGVSANTVIKYLTHAGIHACSGPAIDGGPRYLYRREDLADFDLTMIEPSRRAKSKLHSNQMNLFDEAA